MTVQELIDELEKYDKNVRIKLWEYDEYYGSTREDIGYITEEGSEIHGTRCYTLS